MDTKNTESETKPQKTFSKISWFFDGLATGEVIIFLLCVSALAIIFINEYYWVVVASEISIAIATIFFLVFKFFSKPKEQGK
jgi:hypothetical protein